MYTKPLVTLPSLASVRANTPGTAGTSSVASTSQEKPGSAAAFTSSSSATSQPLPSFASFCNRDVGTEHSFFDPNPNPLPYASNPSGPSYTVQGNNLTEVNIGIEASNISPDQGAADTELLRNGEKLAELHAICLLWVGTTEGEPVTSEPATSKFRLQWNNALSNFTCGMEIKDKVTYMKLLESKLEKILEWARISKFSNSYSEAILSPFLSPSTISRPDVFLEQVNKLEMKAKFLLELIEKKAELNKQASRLLEVYKVVGNVPDAKLLSLKDAWKKPVSLCFKEGNEGNIKDLLQSINSRLTSILEWTVSPEVSDNMKKDFLTPLYMLLEGKIPNLEHFHKALDAAELVRGNAQ